jgi:S-adenosylmethionine decarboxylase proenzyme
MNTLGKHIVADFAGCDSGLLNQKDFIKQMMCDAATLAGATVIDVSFHEFQPQGVSGVVVLAESHISIHTWPERGYAAMDFYTCGDHTDPSLAVEHAKQTLRAARVFTTSLLRGIELESGTFVHAEGAHE